MNFVDFFPSKGQPRSQIRPSCPSVLLLLLNWFGDLLADPQVKIVACLVRQVPQVYLSVVRMRFVCHYSKGEPSGRLFHFHFLYALLHLCSLNLQVSWNVFVYFLTSTTALAKPGQMECLKIINEFAFPLVGNCRTGFGVVYSLFKFSNLTSYKNSKMF